MPSRTKAAKPASAIEQLPTILPKAFDQAQNSTANHLKNFAILHTLHADAATHTEELNGGESLKLVGERAFEDAYVDCVSRVLGVKKGVGQADRIVRFVGGFTKYINEKGASRLQPSFEFISDTPQLRNTVVLTLRKMTMRIHPPHDSRLVCSGSFSKASQQKIRQCDTESSTL